MALYGQSEQGMAQKTGLILFCKREFEFDFFSHGQLRDEKIRLSMIRGPPSRASRGGLKFAEPCATMDGNDEVIFSAS
jgi:hypothetical protein